MSNSLNTKNNDIVEPYNNDNRTININDCDIKSTLKKDNNKSLLRFITCGSVDDGKSTLIGRLLYDSKFILKDQLDSLINESKSFGTQNGEIDFALLVDGLSAEREQGITIDVAYRFFATDKRKFIVADTPGHEEYTRNMATGASTADLAIILIDARKSILQQTKRHSFIANLLGIKHILIAVNKMDLVDYSQDIFNKIISDYKIIADNLGINDLTFIPISALNGDNIVKKSTNMQWHDGLPLIEYLENIEITSQNISDQENNNFRLPVQFVNRPNLDFRGFCGNIASGKITTGDKVTILPSGKNSIVKSILVGDNDGNTASSGQAVTITLNDEIDISRGDIIVTPISKPMVNNVFQAHIIWMNDNQMLINKNYQFKSCNKIISGNISKINHKININDFCHIKTKSLSLNEVGMVNISLDQPMAFDRYDDNKTTGAFIMIDRLTNETVACGMIIDQIKSDNNIHWQKTSIDAADHARQKSQKPIVLWFTGLSGSGKSSIANLVEKKLYSLGKHSFILDGDNIRHGLNKDLDFSQNGRIENIRRISEVAKLMSDAGLIILTSFISPFASDRQMAKKMLGVKYMEIFIDAPLAICQNRDPKGLYKKVKAGEISNFTGIDSPYEKPVNPDIHIKSHYANIEDCADLIIKYLNDNDLI